MRNLDMRNRVRDVFLVSLAIALVVGIYFRVGGAIPVAVTQTQKMSTFDVSGEGKIVVIPDQAVLSLGVLENGSSLKAVQEQVNSKMASLTKSLKTLGVEEKDIRTTSYSYYPDYRDRSRYVASASVTVTVRDLVQVSPALDLVGTLGLDNVSGPSFGLSDELMEKSIKEAREMAIGKAKAKAEELSSLAGMKLGRIINIVEGSNYPSPYEVRMALPEVGGGMDLSKTETPVEAGSSEVNVTVTLSYETI